MKATVTQPTITYGTTYANSSATLAFDTARQLIWSTNKGNTGIHGNVGG